MVYNACGSGRDSFIFLHQEVVKGRNYQPKILFSDAERLTSFWKNKDKQSQLLETGSLKPKEKDTFPSKKSLRATTHEEELAQTTRQRLRNGVPVSATRDDVSILHHRSMPEAEKRFRLEKLKDVPVRIPGYSGHVPCAKETVGLSSTSNRFLEEVTTKALSQEQTRNKFTEKRIADDSIRRMDRTLELPSFRRMNRQEVQQMQGSLGGLNPSSTTTNTARKIIRKPKVEVPHTHHIAGFSGHQPRSLHSLQCYEKSKQETKF